MHSHLRVQTLSIAILAGLCGSASAGKIVAVMLDVPVDQAPQYLCVVADKRSCDDGAHDKKTGRLTNEQLCRTRELSDLADADVLRVDTGSQDGSFAELKPGALARRHPGVSLPSDLSEVLKDLAEAPSTKCSERHRGCAPRIDLHGYLDAHRPLGNIICGGDKTSSTGLVAILSLTFNDPPHASGITDIALHGTSATLTLDDDLASNVVFMHVIGGHYAASKRSSTGTTDRTALALQPRCTPYTAVLPPQFPKPIQSVVLTTTGSGQANLPPVSGQPSSDPPATPESTCGSDADRDQLKIQIPFGGLLQHTTLTVTTATSTGADTATYEASWSDALPPRPLHLAVRSLDFSWHRDCLSGEWPSPASRPKEWSGGCPSATIAEAGAACTLMPASSTASDVCHYRCRAIDDMAPFELPVQVQFDRIRTPTTQGSDAAVEVVYSWRDTIHTAGEHLRSFVAPADRRLFIELSPPDKWVDQGGETFDAVRAVLPDGTTENVELTSGGARDRSIAWYVIAAPNVTCTDRIRIAVFGSHLYDETTIAARGGRIVLLDPEGRRSRLNFWVTAGLGITNERFDDTTNRIGASAALGIQLEKYAGPGALEAGVIAQVGRSGFAVTDGAVASAAIHGVPYLRTDLRAGYEVWAVSGLHLGAAIGIGVGHPLYNRDDAKVGAAQRSYVGELNVRNRLGRRLGLWSELALGVRLGEDHLVFPAADVSSTVRTMTLTQPYMTLRFWFRLG